VKEVFDLKISDVNTRILKIKDEIIELNKKMNSRNSSLVKDIAIAVT
jgi:hypothetical protein